LFRPGRFKVDVDGRLTVLRSQVEVDVVDPTRRWWAEEVPCAAAAAAAPPLGDGDAKPSPRLRE